MSGSLTCQREKERILERARGARAFLGSTEKETINGTLTLGKNRVYK